MLGLVGRRCQNGCVAGGGGGGGLEAVGVPFSVSPVRKERRAAQRRESESVPLSTTSWITVSAPSDHTRSINEAWFLSVISSP